MIYRKRQVTPRSSVRIVYMNYLRTLFDILDNYSFGDKPPDDSLFRNTAAALSVLTKDSE